MKSDLTEQASTADLTALAAAHGSPSQVGAASAPAPKSSQNERDSDLMDETRLAKVAQLKAKYKAGRLTVDEAAVAAKLIESELKENPPSQK